MINVMIFSSVLLSFFSVLAVDASDAKYAFESDTVAVVDTLAADSIVKGTLAVAVDSVAADSLMTVTDTLSVDTVTKAVPVNKSEVITNVLASRETYNLSWNVPLSVLNKISDKDRALLISYYKNIIKADHSPEAYVKAYSPWREAFMGSSDRSLDLYTDGVGIIIANIDADTLHHEVDRIGILAKDLMELYDLAVKNVDKLNAQIDFTKTKDSITVAKLRAQQVSYFRRFFEIDSIVHAAHHNTFNAENELYWENFMFKDSTQMNILYPWYLEILSSPDTDVNIMHVAHFAKLLDYKFIKDNKISLEYAKENFTRDRELAEAKAIVLLENADPFKIVDKNRNLNQKDYYASQFKGIKSTLDKTQSRVIAIDDYASYEKLFAERLKNEGPKMWPEILNSPLSKYTSSELYWNALVHKYNNNEQAEFIPDAGPSYELARQIAELSLKQGKYKEALNYTDYAMAFPEFDAETDFKKAQTYMIIVQTYDKVGGYTRERMKYIKKAMEICPDYPEPYYYEASAIFNVSLGNKASQEAKFAKYWIAYDRYELAKSKLTALSPGTDIETKLTVEIINNAQVACRNRFPDTMTFFQLGWKEGTPKTLSLAFGTYTTTMRSSK